MGTKSPAPVAHPRLWRHAAVFPVFVLLILWLWLLSSVGGLASGPGGRSFGTDFAISMGAASVVNHGGNPYNRALLLRTERRYLLDHGVPRDLIPSGSSYDRTVIRVGNPPLFFGVLQPLIRFPFQPLAIAWMVALYLVMAAGFACTLGYLGWHRGSVAMLLFLGAPPVVMGAYYGNVDCLIFGAVGSALAALRRHPLLAGLILSIGWLKPQVALPVIALIVLFHPAVARKVAIGFGLSTACLLAVTVTWMGPNSVSDWISGLLGYPGHMTIQPDIATLGGLVSPIPSPAVRLALEALAVVAACMCVGAVWWRARRQSQVSFPSVAWLWVAVFLAVPFAHFHDEVILTPAVLAMFGSDARRLLQAASLAVLYLVFLSVIPLALHPDGLNFLSLPLIAIGICMYTATRQSSAEAEEVDTDRVASPAFT